MRLAPSLHRIGNDIVAAYLIVTPEGITLVDAGLPGMYSDLTRELDAIGRSLDDIRGILLTHGDSDHVLIARVTDKAIISNKERNFSRMIG